MTSTIAILNNPARSDAEKDDAMNTLGIAIMQHSETPDTNVTRAVVDALLKTRAPEPGGAMHYLFETSASTLLATIITVDDYWAEVALERIKQFLGNPDAAIREKALLGLTILADVNQAITASVLRLAEDATERTGETGLVLAAAYYVIDSAFASEQFPINMASVLYALKHHASHPETEVRQQIQGIVGAVAEKSPSRISDDMLDILLQLAPREKDESVCDALLLNISTIAERGRDRPAVRDGSIARVLAAIAVSDDTDNSHRAAELLGVLLGRELYLAEDVLKMIEVQAVKGNPEQRLATQRALGEIIMPDAPAFLQKARDIANMGARDKDPLVRGAATEILSFIDHQESLLTGFEIPSRPAGKRRVAAAPSQNRPG
jgi:hypothetical protein